MIPNPYQGNYKLLIIFPLILIAVAIYFIPQVKLGVEFQGGTLITIATKEKIDAVELQTKLFEDGLDAKVTSFETAVGPQTEI